jgi:hypothetical protein
VKFRRENIVPRQKCWWNGWEHQMMMPLGKMSGGFLSPTPIFVLEDKDNLSGQDCYMLHSMHAWQRYIERGCRRGHKLIAF